MPRIIAYLIGLYMIYRIVKNVSFFIKELNSKVAKTNKKDDDIIEAEYEHID